MCGGSPVAMDQRYIKLKNYVRNFKLDFCCWFFPVRIGLLLIGSFNVIYSLVSLMGMADDSFTPILIQIQDEDTATKPIPVLAYAVQMASNVVLLCGLYRRDQALMMVYVRYCVVSIITDVMLYSLVATLGLWTTVAMVSNIIFQLYVLVLVQSTIVDYRLLKKLKYQQFPLDYITTKPEKDVIVINKPKKEIVLFEKPETVKIFEIPENDVNIVNEKPQKQVIFDVVKPQQEVKVDVEIPPNVIKVDVESIQEKKVEEKPPRKHSFWTMKNTKKTEEKIVKKPDDKIVVTDKPKDTTIVIETPKEKTVALEKQKNQPIIIEQPKDKIVVIEKPKEKTVVFQKPVDKVVIEKREDKIVSETPKEKNIVVEKPADKVEGKVVIEKAIDKVAVIEKSEGNVAVIEKPQDAEVINVENPNVEDKNEETNEPETEQTETTEESKQSKSKIKSFMKWKKSKK